MCTAPLQKKKIYVYVYVYVYVRSHFGSSHSVEEVGGDVRKMIGHLHEEAGKYGLLLHMGKTKN